MSSENHESFLVNKYGILMKVEDLAEVLDRSVTSLRKELRSSSSAHPEIATAFRPTMIKLGRRLYFRTIEVAAALSLTQNAS